MKPRHTAEQSTTTVNKREKMGRVGFGAVAQEIRGPASAEAENLAINPVNNIIASLADIRKMDDESQYQAIMAKVSNKDSSGGPTDPQEKFLCDSCQ